MQDQQTLDKIQAIENQIRQAAQAEELKNLEAGKLIPALLTEEITRLTRDVISDKYAKDHQGYIVALGELHANQKLLRKLQSLTNPKRTRKLREARARLTGKDEEE